MWPEDKCDDCPLLKTENNHNLCMAQTLRSSRHCFHAKNGHEGYIRLILGESPKYENIHTVVREHPSSSTEFNGSMMIAKNDTERSEKVAELNRIRKCKHLTPCGCGGGRLGDCDLGLGDQGKVNISDCRSCDKWEEK